VNKRIVELRLDMDIKGENVRNVISIPFEKISGIRKPIQSASLSGALAMYGSAPPLAQCHINRGEVVRAWNPTIAVLQDFPQTLDDPIP
jgi:hypothetical protein